VRDVDASEIAPTAEIAPRDSEVAEEIALAVREEMTALSSVVDLLVREDADSEERKLVPPVVMLNPNSVEAEAVVLPLNKFPLLWIRKSVL